ncbi:unnamed protein product [Clavelina lepadiformis]|uniref:Sushi domain-containing protein n=1 Tax=Clavelina lepadiformis TaxID=159417 RepID=A0ABP0FF51_CLALP
MMKLKIETFAIILLAVKGAAAITSISTDPPNNPLATGFNNLIVTAQFPTPTSNTDACSWYYGGELDSDGSGASFYSGIFGGCDLPLPGTYDSITCTEQTIDGTSHTITTLTITQPLVAGNVNIEVRCTTAITPGSITRSAQDCPSSLSYGVVVTSSSRTYQASGMFSCTTGDLFYSNGTALPFGDTTCLANAEWNGQNNLQCASATAKISADPPNNPLATGFNNLIVTAQFPTPNDSTEACAWYYGGELDSGSGSGAQFYTGLLGGCVAPSPGTYDSITCTEQTIDGTSQIITTLTITQPLVAGNVNIEVRCVISTNTPGPIPRTVQDCPSSLSYGVVITSSFRTYQASGKFSCPTGDLFYSNGTAPSSSNTICLANAQWLAQDNLQCTGASPGTKISTNPPNNPLATGFNNFIVTAQFPTPKDTSDQCTWFYGGELDSGSGASFYSGAFGCDPPAPGTYDTITCTEQTIDGTNHIITTLTISQPLVAGDVNIEVRCSLAATPGPITRTVQDCPSSLSYGVVITSSSRTYQASGMVSCPTGDLFYSNGTAPSSSNTMCLANAQWLAQHDLQCTGASPGTKISTNPSNNPLATGFNNLIVTAQFPTPTDSTEACSWLYGGELGSGSGAQFYSGVFGGCVVPSPGTYDSITCTEQTIDGASHMITTLTITQPLVAGNLNIEVRCAIAVIIPGSVTRLVQDCPSSLPYAVVVTSSSQTYQASGMFSCPTGDLFYSNGTALPSGDTVCLANAEWSGQDTLQCWSASDPFMTGNLIVPEGDTTSLNCNYDETVFPEVTSSIFYFDELGYIVSKGEMFHLKLEKEDNMKPISCQVVTPYTQIYNDTGRSRVEHVNVQYKAVSNDGKDIVFSNGYEQHYLYTRNQVTSSDEGTYKLTLSHLLPPYNYTIEFDITVVNIYPLPTPDKTGAIVGGTVAAVALICITVVVALYITTRQPTKNGKSNTS